MISPLSFTQERLWWSGQVAPASINVPMAMHLDGAINISALEQTLRILVERHPMLRTRFFLHQGTPVQETLAETAIEIPIIHLQDMHADHAEELLRAASERPLELSSPPLFKPYLFQLATHSHLLLIRLSHLIVDDRSRSVLMEEISVIYSALRAAEPLRLPPLPARYSDYAVWERAHAAGPEIEEDLNFWSTYLADLPALLELPLDHPRPPNRSYRGASRSVSFVQPIGSRIRSLARLEGATPFQWLLAGLFILLGRYTCSRDIAIGTPFSHSPDRRYARVIGPFLNTLAIRADCSGRFTFREFLQDIRSRMAGALAHANVPFERVLDRLHIERDASYNPLIQVWFIYKKDVISTVSWGGPKATPLTWHETAMPFDITVAIADCEDSFDCACTYDPALFEARTIERLLDHFNRLLHSIVEEPGRPIGDYELLSATERRQFEEWNHTAVTWPSPPCLQDAVMAMAAQNPKAIAVTTDAGEMTYGALAGATRALAAQLRSVGVTVDSPVAIVMDRSADLVISLLAALAAGGAYLPIDATTSSERMLFILRNAQAACVLTSHALRSRIPDAHCPVLLVHEAKVHSHESCASDDATFRVHGDNLCYVLYTSGTTGEPKGVAVSHKAVMNLLESYAQALEVTAADTMLAIAPITFDIATLEIFLPLIRGGRVAIAPEHTAADGADLRARLARDGVTIMQATPATWRLLMDTGWQAAPGIRVICGAEPLPTELAREFIARVGHVWNSYGPTETTIYSTFQRISSEEGPITIGRPMGNTSIYVLDSNLVQVPVGVHGEIYLAGDGLARGYLGRPDLTAMAFQPDPFNSQPGSRMYASGDFGYFLPDGQIACHGRRDHQVKINGRRIELEAISGILDAHPLVRNSVVLRQAGPAGPCLIAYVASTVPSQVQRAELREHLRRYLPSYMVPSAFVILDALPKTSRGKLDRRALPRPSESDFHCTNSIVAAQTSSEEAIAEIWHAILPTQTIGMEDDFFALGGNSLQVTRVLQEVRDSLGVELSVQTFFQASTIAALARRVDQEKHKTAAGSRPVVRPLLRNGHLKLAPQQENWWYNEFLTGNIHPNNIHFALSFTGRLHLSALEQSVSLLQQRHEALRTAFVRGESGSAEVIITSADNCEISVLHVDLTQAPLQEDVLRRISQQEKNRPFDLARGNLCRVVLVHLGPESYVLFFTVHHLVFDEWSMDILMKDVSIFYENLIMGTVPQLPELSFQYADFAQWQREWLAGPEAAKQFSFWRQRLAPPLPLLLKEPHHEEELQGVGFAIRGRVPFTITEQAEFARHIAQSERVTLFSTVIAVIKIALYVYSQQPDLRIGTLIANRNLPGAAHVVGLFTNVVCLRLEVDPAIPFRKFLQVVHSTIGDATAHQDLPFEIMMRDLQTSQGTVRSSVLQALVVWLAMPSQDRLNFVNIRTGAYRPDDEDEDSVVMARSTLDLRFEFEESPTAITGNITYNPSKFTNEEIHEILEIVKLCFRLAEQNPEASLAKLFGNFHSPLAEGVQVS